MNRRTILTGLLAAPFVIRTPGLLMPVRRVEPVNGSRLQPFSVLAARHKPIGAHVVYGVPPRATPFTDWNGVVWDVRLNGTLIIGL